MSIKLLDFRNIDLSNITFLSPEKQRNSHFSKAKYEDEDIYIKTTKMINKNGLVKNDNRAYIELEFGEDKNLYDFMCSLDERCINVIHEKSEDWFNKQFPKDVVEEFYLGPLKHKGEPKLKLKVPLSKSSIDCLIYDNVGNCTQDLGSDNTMICVLQFIGLKFLKQQVIAEWVPLQVKTSNIVNMQSKNYLIEENLDDEVNEDIEQEEEIELNDEDLNENDDFSEKYNINSNQYQEQLNSFQDNTWEKSLNEVQLTDLENEEVLVEETPKSEVEIELEKYKDKLRHIKSEINSILLD